MCASSSLSSSISSSVDSLSRLVLRITPNDLMVACLVMCSLYITDCALCVPVQPLYDTAYLTLYNISFTSLPILLYSLIEKHVSIETLKRDPTLYRSEEHPTKTVLKDNEIPTQKKRFEPIILFLFVETISLHLPSSLSPPPPFLSLSFRLRDVAKNALLRWPVFLYWTCLGLFNACIFFFGAYFLFDNTTFTSNGQVSPGYCLHGQLSRTS